MTEKIIQSDIRDTITPRAYRLVALWQPGSHIEPVASELVVHSGHSTQDHPETIEEVRRILLEHLRESAD